MADYHMEDLAYEINLESAKIAKEVADKFTKGEDRGTWLAINSGTIEMKDNKVIVLAD